MIALTEDRIKTASLRFLKSHYKFRPRIGPTTAQFDMESEEGIIADGHLFFMTGEGYPFLATFEATSEHLFEEVKFKPELRVLFWDSMAAAFIIAAMTYSYGLIWDEFSVAEVGWKMTLSVLFVAGFIGFWIYRYTNKGRHRYRYIYAIEQFKRYHADDQWIAISDAIFPNSEDIYFEELKRQCVDNGIGLVSVAKDETVKLLVTPAREDVFNNKRKLIHFVNREIDKKRSWGRRISDSGRNFLDAIFGRSQNSSSLQRYRHSFYRQILLCIGALGLIVTIFFRQLQDRPLEYVNENSYGAELQKKVNEGPMETMEYLVDTSAIVGEGQFETPYPLEEKIDLENSSSNVEEELGAGSLEIWTMESEPQSGGRVVLNREGENATSYDCERLYNFEGYLYLIRYTHFPNIAQAQREVKRLEQKGLTASILWRACFEGANDDYVLYFDLFYPKRAEAEEVLLKYKTALNRQELAQKELRLIRIQK